MWSTVFAGLVTIVLPYIKIGGYVGLAPLSLSFWVLLLGIVGVYVGLVSLVKYFVVRRWSEWV